MRSRPLLNTTFTAQGKAIANKGCPFHFLVGMWLRCCRASLRVTGEKLRQSSNQRRCRYRGHHHPQPTRARCRAEASPTDFQPLESTVGHQISALDPPRLVTAFRLQFLEHSLRVNPITCQFRTRISIFFCFAPSIQAACKSRTMIFFSFTTSVESLITQFPQSSFKTCQCTAVLYNEVARLKEGN